MYILLVKIKIIFRDYYLLYFLYTEVKQWEPKSSGKSTVVNRAPELGIPPATHTQTDSYVATWLSLLARQQTTRHHMSAA